jgi:hypothetical protein
LLENNTQSEHKIPILTVHFLGIRGLTACVLCDCTSSGHKGAVVYICNVFIYIHYVYISIQYIHLFMMD